MPRIHAALRGVVAVLSGAASGVDTIANRHHLHRVAYHWFLHARSVLRP